MSTGLSIGVVWRWWRWYFFVQCHGVTRDHELESRVAILKSHVLPHTHPIVTLTHPEPVRPIEFKPRST